MATPGIVSESLNEKRGMLINHAGDLRYQIGQLSESLSERRAKLTAIEREIADIESFMKEHGIEPQPIKG